MPDPKQRLSHYFKKKRDFWEQHPLNMTFSSPDIELPSGEPLPGTDWQRMVKLFEELLEALENDDFQPLIAYVADNVAHIEEAWKRMSGHTPYDTHCLREYDRRTESLLVALVEAKEMKEALLILLRQHTCEYRYRRYNPWRYRYSYSSPSCSSFNGHP